MMSVYGICLGPRGMTFPITLVPDPDAEPYKPNPNSAKRVKFAFRVDFTNGGHVAGEDFLLDISGEDPTPERLAEMIPPASSSGRAGDDPPHGGCPPGRAPTASAGPSSSHSDEKLWAANRARNSIFEIFLAAVCGISSTNTTSSGIHHFAIALEVCQDALRETGATGDHHEKRALIPFGMRKPDSSRFGDTWTAEREIFELDRRDPFTTGFDDILCPIDDLHIAMRVDRRHVASVEPALRVECRCSLVLEVSRGDPRTFHFEPAECLAVLGRSQS